MIIKAEQGPLVVKPHPPLILGTTAHNYPTWMHMVETTTPTTTAHSCQPLPPLLQYRGHTTTLPTLNNNSNKDSNKDNKNFFREELVISRRLITNRP